jgi:hypothetical protein
MKFEFILIEFELKHYKKEITQFHWAKPMVTSTLAWLKAGLDLGL